MTLVAQPIILEIRDGKTRQLSSREMASIETEMSKMFGMIADNPQTFQSQLDRYCQRKGRKPLIITDIYI